MMTRKALHLKALALLEGNQDVALKWCNDPNLALGWKTPVEVMRSEERGFMVASLILRIGHGVCS